MCDVQCNNLRDVWCRNLEKFPSRIAVIHEGKSYTYRECDLLAVRLRRDMAERLGFKQGDMVALAGPNCLEYFIAYWAALKSGGVAVPVNVRLGVGELAHLIGQSDASILFVHKWSRRAVGDAMRSCANIKHLVSMGFEDDRFMPCEAMIAAGDAYDFHPEIKADDPAVVMYTSGTTGRPKGAMMRHADLLFNNELAISAHGLRHDDVHLLAVPMFHATALYSLVPASALTGATILLAPRPEPRALVELIQEHRATTFFGVPALLRFVNVLPDLDQYDLSSLRLIAYAGSAMPAATISRLRELFPRAKLHNFFGLTETTSMTHVLPDSDAEVRPESIGKLLPGVRQRILDEQGNDVPPGAVGELHFHRSNVISSYWKQPDLLEQSMRGDWFNTGDLARVDAGGYVYLKGRSKEMIIVGGENVYAVEVENCLVAHEKVAEAAVIGVPATGSRAHLGELIKAVIVPEEGEELTQPQIKRHCMERLASYKVPQIIEFRPTLPRNAAGKVLKRML